MSFYHFSITLLLSLFTTVGAFAQSSWSTTTTLRCTTSDQAAPFKKLEVVYIQRASHFYVVRVFKSLQSRYNYENFTSAPTQHNKVIYSNYQITRPSEKMRFELMVHVPSGEAYVLFESNKNDHLSMLQPSTNFKCDILEPKLIAQSNTP